MTRRVIGALVAYAVLTSAVPARADEKLAFLIPHLFGPAGLVVDSEARLPNGQTHSAHFNSAFQAEFTQFNVALASQLTGLPIPSPASGFTYTLDPTLGLFNRSTRTFGLETYVHAVEAKDVQMFRTVKPNLSEDEERRARAAFKSVQSQVVKMNVLSLDVKDGRATVKVARRDTINGSIVSSFPQTFQLAKEPTGWTIHDIGR